MSEQSRPGTHPQASLLDNLRFNLYQVLPNLAQGLFSRRPRMQALCSRLDTDGRTLRLVDRLRRRHGGYVWVRVLVRRSLLVLDPEGIRRVLDRSPAAYGPPGAKLKGMSHFQPGAVTLSTGEAWAARRAFNEAVLESGRRLHRDAGSFLALIGEEVAGRRGAATLDQEDFARLFERIMLGVLFGPSARAESHLAAALTRLMRQANRLVALRRGPDHATLEEGIDRHLAAPEEGSLAARVAARETAPEVAARHQVPHWMFALKDTLATNTLRALALVASHPEIERRVREEMAGADLGSPAGIDGLELLEGVIQEAMRLWPTTPMLSRESLEEDTLGGRKIPAGTQIVILNTFNHRDRSALASPHACAPEEWRGSRSRPPLNHFSGGPQACAGIDLALFVAKAVLAGLLDGRRWVLDTPALDGRRPLPAMLDPSTIRLRAADPAG